jgi:hypothetical protein
MKKAKETRETENSEQDIWVEVVVKLMLLTQEGRLHWNRSDPSSLSNHEVDAYTTEYNGKHIRLTERELPEPPKDSLEYRLLSSSGLHSRTVFILEFVDEHGRSLWKFPQTSALRGLMSAVRYQAADVKTFLHEILNDKEVSQ